MTTNNFARFRRNIFGAPEPLIYPGAFQAGSTAAVKAGALIELTADGNSKWVEMDSDFNGAANVAIAACEIKSGDRAGYYPIIVPRPGDIFEFALSAAGDPVLGAALYWSDAETLAESGSNAVAYVADFDHYPAMQGHLADDASPDQGTTLRSVSYVGVFIDAAASYYAALVQ